MACGTLLYQISRHHFDTAVWSALIQAGSQPQPQPQIDLERQRSNSSSLGRLPISKVERWIEKVGLLFGFLSFNHLLSFRISS